MKKKAARRSGAAGTKKAWALSLAALFLLLAGTMAWLIFGPATDFDDASRKVWIEPEKTNRSEVLQAFESAGILRFTSLLGWVGAPINLWDKLKPGPYEIKKGQSVFSIVRMLRNGRLAQTKLVINKVRTKADMARLISKQFPIDSNQALAFMNSPAAIAFLGSDTARIFTHVLPDTYQFYYNADLPTIFKKLDKRSRQFWQENNREEKALALGLNPEQVYILASIVEEETNHASDKLKIASVYLNRLKKEMPLQACPTIKYAMNNFALTRIYEKYLSNPSPYNTYRVKGLPPGPICTPSPATIDMVLDAPTTDYLFFVAKSDFSGFHHFTSNYKDHDRYAVVYQKALDSLMQKKNPLP
jgi:UPF0755 protein